MEKYLKEFVTAARLIAEHKLVFCNSGNLSWRIDDQRMLITSTDSWMANLSNDKVSLCQIEDSVSLNEQKPSKEIGFHAAILRQRRDINVVLHFNSPYATAAGCCRREIENFFVIPEIPYYIGPVTMIPYLTPGSTELAEAVTSAIMEHDLVILRNHGLVTVGKTFEHVIEKATFFELACKIIFVTGSNVQHIPKGPADDLRRAYKTNHI